MTTKTIDIKQLANEIERECPQIAFAYLFGSAQNGIIKQGSDIDIAVYITPNASKSETIIKISEITETIAGDVATDIIFLNHCGTTIAFEALKGIRLFVNKDQVNTLAEFYSWTCRLYESEKYWMKKQLQYRNYEVQWDN